jgi:hypothetical protein
MNMDIYVYVYTHELARAGQERDTLIASRGNGGLPQHFSFEFVVQSMHTGEEPLCQLF